MLSDEQKAKLIQQRFGNDASKGLAKLYMEGIELGYELGKGVELEQLEFTRRQNNIISKARSVFTKPCSNFDSVESAIRAVYSLFTELNLTPPPIDYEPDWTMMDVPDNPGVEAEFAKLGYKLHILGNCSMQGGQPGHDMMILWVKRKKNEFGSECIVVRNAPGSISLHDINKLHSELTGHLEIKPGLFYNTAAESKHPRPTA